MSDPRRLDVLAENEAIIRFAPSDMLTSLGFEMLEAEHANGALQHLEAHAGVALL
ncbi:hypothetical protein [Methylobacterium sp. CM6257]|jgi:hypothetical protein